MTGSLGDLDLRRMRDLLAAAESAPPTDPAGLPEAVLATLTELVPCDAASFADFDVRHSTQYLVQDCEDGVVTTNGELRDEQDPFYRHYWNTASCAYPTRTGDIRTVTMRSDFYSRREWHATPMYQDYFRAQGIDHDLVCCLSDHEGHTRRVVLFRCAGTDFSERDRLVLSLLRPHLADLGARAASAATRLLTPRQHELLALIAAGHSTAQIAATLYLSQGTVRKHVDNIFERLGVTSRTAAVMRVFGQA